jgi:phenylpropionate dioxygenase-like ring-hydroxylating dioxygenase large terminal subunit
MTNVKAVDSREAQYPLPPRTVEAAFYLDEPQYQRELAHVFLPSWLPVCSVKEVAKPRDYVVWDHLRQSVVVVRQEDGTLAAWHNVCQHRGARLVDQSGTSRYGKFKCPWHSFVYDLSGKCTGVPMRSTFDERELQGLRLPAVRVAEWNGLVWITLSDSTPELKGFLGALWDELGWYRMDSFEIRYRATLDLNANWKVVVDAFNETWHVPSTHEQTLSSMVLWRDAHIRICSPHSWMTLPIAGYTEKFGSQVDHHEGNLCHYLCFPNTIFSCFPTHLQMWSAWPVSPTRTVLVAWGLVGPAPKGLTEEEWAERSDRNWAHFLNVSAEDAKVINDFGTVAHSLGFKRNMFNTAESRLSAFYDEIVRRVGPPCPTL